MKDIRLSKEQYNAILKTVAEQHGTTADEIKKEIQKTIDLAWENPKLGHKAAQIELFGHPNQPTPEELIAKIARGVQRKEK